jgi:hypothetical protein
MCYAGLREHDRADTACALEVPSQIYRALIDAALDEI